MRRLTAFHKSFARTLGTGTTAVQTQYNYYEWDVDYQGGRLQWLKSGTPNTTPANPTAFQHFEYSYSAVGNVMSISDHKMGSPQTQTFTYDNLDRLLSAAAGGGSQGNYAESG